MSLGLGFQSPLAWFWLATRTNLGAGLGELWAKACSRARKVV
jgi:hypothetical protein